MAGSPNLNGGETAAAIPQARQGKGKSEVGNFTYTTPKKITWAKHDMYNKYMLGLFIHLVLIFLICKTI